MSTINGATNLISIILLLMLPRRGWFSDSAISSYFFHSPVDGSSLFATGAAAK